MEAYRTITGPAQAEYEEKKSRFIGQVAPVKTEDEALAFLEEVRTDNPMARHNVYAYVLRENNRKRYSDDGEPARTAGLPTLSVIEHLGLSDVICVTTRYFGGTLLGTGGLVRAYTKAAQDAFAAAQVVTYAACRDVTITVGYPLYEPVRHFFEARSIDIANTSFAENVTLVARVEADDAETVQAALVEMTSGRAKINVGDQMLAPITHASDSLV